MQFELWMNTEFVESRQAWDKAASWCRQDPVRLMSASDTQAGRERNTKMAAACSICHDAMSDVSMVVVKDVLNKMSDIFFPILFRFPPSSVTEIKRALLLPFLLCGDLLHHRAVLFLVLLLLLSVFSKSPSELVKQKLPCSSLTSPSWWQWSQMGWPHWGWGRTRLRSRKSWKQAFYLLDFGFVHLLNYSLIHLQSRL